MIISDLHIHSRFSRATSKNTDLKNLEKYARIKGVNLLGSGDFQHPKWNEELNNNLEEDDKGILWSKTGFPFIWQSELSLIYTQDGKGRRIHHVIFAPNKEVVNQITETLSKKGRLDYDGRPIFGFSSIEFVDLMQSISSDIEIIPAHCLLPNSFIYTQNGLKEIKDVKIGNFVFTHLNNLKKVTEVLRRKYSGEIFGIVPSCLNLENWFTPEHPIYSIKTFKICKNSSHSICKPSCAYLKRGCKVEAFKNYIPEWVQVKDLKIGDVVLYPRYKKVRDRKKLDLTKKLNKFYLDGKFVKPRKGKIFIKNIPVYKKIEISEKFCRLIGYYLAEGWTSKCHIGFAFNKDETEYIKDVKKLLIEVFGPFLNIKIKETPGSNGISLIIYSKILSEFFKIFYNSNVYKAHTKTLPRWFIELPNSKLTQTFLGWWRGDKGVTSSPYLMNQFKTILIKMGIIPTINKISSKDTNLMKLKRSNLIGNRRIKANHDSYTFRLLSFFNDSTDILNLAEFKKFKTKLNRRKGWIDEDYIYLPILKILKKKYTGLVYNLEVIDDNSYLTECLSVHNCMTPWFGLFGSKSGFDSLKDCFKERTNKIFAVETGISADPPMLWRLKEDINLVSFSDAHSFWPWRIGREATIFDCELNYKNILKAIRTKEGLKSTIETVPDYGKYHYDGHRNCNISLSPEETKKLNGICPKCGKELTIGVQYRIEELAKEKEGFVPKNNVEFKRLIPLTELISKAYDVKMISSKKAWIVYNLLIKKFGNEFNVLLNASEEELKSIVNDRLVKLIMASRQDKLYVKPGYDGVYGEISENE